MQITAEQAFIKIGTQALEIDILTGQLQQAQERIKELEAPPVVAGAQGAPLEVVK